MESQKKDACPVNRAKNIYFTQFLELALRDQHSPTFACLCLSVLPLFYLPAQASSSPVAPWPGLFPGLLPAVSPLQSIPHPGPRKILESSPTHTPSMAPYYCLGKVSAPQLVFTVLSFLTPRRHTSPTIPL